MKLEVLEKDGYYHIYNRGINSENIFLSDENKTYFLKLLSKYFDNQIDIFAYCLMDNHFHFVIKVTNDEKTVTQAFSNFFNAYAKAFNKQNHRTGSLFEKHFKRIKLSDETYLRQLILYVHLNPQHHLNIAFENYKFSSYKAFLTDKETKVKKDDVLLLFENRANFIFCHNQKNSFLAEKFALE